MIFSKNHTSWGSFFYDPKEDALRVKVKPEKSEYHEWLTYEFTDREPDHATVAMKWEDLQVPIDDHGRQQHRPLSRAHPQRAAQLTRDSPGRTGSRPRSTRCRTSVPPTRWSSRDGAVHRTVRRPGKLPDADDARRGAGSERQDRGGEGDAREGAATIRPRPIFDLHSYGRQLLAQGKKEEALRVWQLNAKRHPNEWPVNVGLARGYSAVGNYKEALKYAKLAVAQAPDDGNKKNLEDAIKKLEAGKDMN